ncbi:SWI/SNF complex subunit SWI3B-like [Pyrus communis]|uniref:SWI/SNF complex subunit SWI3B-like n=1 Tax=Pyrus communis TaxID=23211 RepID=UPI0035BEEB4B
MGRGWDDEDTMHLLEALTHYGDDWRKVAQYVGKSEKEFVTHFIKIPFGEEFIADLESKDAPSPCKRMCLTPLADAGNPIMAQGHQPRCAGRAFVDANSQLEKEGMDVEREISGITQIHEKIVRFEALELHMEKEWQKLEQMKSMLFLDKLTLLFVKS